MKTISLTKTNPNDGLYEEVKGNVKVFPISEYINWIEINCTPNDDVQLILNDSTRTSLHFIYNLKDIITLSTSEKRTIQNLTTFQSGIIHQKEADNCLLELRTNGDYKLCIIEFNKSNENQEVNDFFLQFETVFKSSQESYCFIHTGLQNLQLLNYVKNVMSLPKTLLSEKLMVLGYINIILSIKLKQYLNYNKSPLEQLQFTTSEIRRIRAISEQINEDPSKDYNIDNICREFGLSANKLQSGFRALHGKTVCNYVNHVRLNRAEKLLQENDLNVSEIVFSLGWTSRSYFSKIFKEKFECTPKQYQIKLGFGTSMLTSYS